MVMIIIYDTNYYFPDETDADNELLWWGGRDWRPLHDAVGVNYIMDPIVSAIQG